MEKLLRPYDKEYMRMSMLQHEETFKQQVHELHRLYQIQKRLMRSTDESKRHNDTNGNVQKKSRLRIDLEQPYLNINVAEDAPSEVIDESEIELTLGPSSYSRRKKSATTPLTSDQSGGPGSLSSSSTESSQVNRRISNIAGNLKGGVSMTLGFQNGSKTNSISTVHGEEELTQERIAHQPPWFYKVLTLNMT